MRIASLVPSATEMLFALGLGESVVAVTHECDYPLEASGRARLTRSVIPDGLAPGAVDAAVREVTGEGRALYELDEDALRGLDVDLIVTQALCAVCAVSYDDVRTVAERLPTRPRVLSLDPETLGEVIDDVVTLGRATGAEDTASRLRDDLTQRIAAVRTSVADSPQPRVLALEWLDPPYVGGHWVPEMIELAGGTPVLGEPGRKSRTATWDELAGARPDAVVVMPCGLYVDEAREQASASESRLASLDADRIYAVDAAGSFSRPGPRLVDGIELLAHLLHPDRVGPPPGLAWRELQLARGLAGSAEKGQ